MIDTAAVEAFGQGFAFAIFCLVLAWGTLAIVQMAKQLLSGVMP